MMSNNVNANVDLNKRMMGYIISSLDISVNSLSDDPAEQDGEDLQFYKEQLKFFVDKYQEAFGQCPTLISSLHMTI